MFIKLIIFDIFKKIACLHEMKKSEYSILDRNPGYNKGFQDGNSPSLSDLVTFIYYKLYLHTFFFLINGIIDDRLNF